MKFVICDRADYEWSRAKLAEYQLVGTCEILFSPVYGQIEPRQLAEWILADNLPVRMQVQLHKFLWGEARGTERRAVVLLSGGLDSATTLALAQAEGRTCYALTFDYGQRHRVELDAAKRVAHKLGAADHRVMPLDLSWMGGSALTDRSMTVPTSPSTGIPVTYVPARNTVFLSIALGWAEVLGAHDIYIGVNAVDYSGYPDCRPEYLQAFERLANLGTRAGVEGQGFRIHAPLVSQRKAEIIRTGASRVDYGLTVSCYDPDTEGRACGKCDSCRFRAQGFAEAGNPTRPGTADGFGDGIEPRAARQGWRVCGFAVNSGENSSLRDVPRE